MRGIDHEQSDMFSYLSPERRVRKDHPQRMVRTMTDEILERMLQLFDAMYADGGGVDPSREAAASTAFADAVFGAVGAPADGGDRLQHSVPLVCGA